MPQWPRTHLASWAGGGLAGGQAGDGVAGFGGPSFRPGQWSSAAPGLDGLGGTGEGDPAATAVTFSRDEERGAPSAAAGTSIPAAPPGSMTATAAGTWSASAGPRHGPPCQWRLSP
jgi:hypothetical protein